jgi:hypothetical protein
MQVNGAAAAEPFWEILSPGSTAGSPRQVAVLPRGKVEMVFVVDETKRLVDEGGKKQRWRLSFDYAAFAYNEDGSQRRDTQIVPRVTHCFGVLYRVMRKLVEYGLRPIYARKESGDEFVVGLWKQPMNPRQPLEVVGYPVRFFEVEDGKQCPYGFDETVMSVVTDVKEFTP